MSGGRRVHIGLPSIAALAFGVTFGAPTHDAFAQADRVLAYVEHEVRAGDTVYLISVQYGSTVRRIVRENRIRNVRRLLVGTRLRIPIVANADPGAATRLRERAAPALARSVRSVEELVSRGNDELRRARYEQALETGADGLERLADVPDARANPLRAQLNVVRAIAQVALDDRDGARQSLEEALSANPELSMDPERTSPKVLAVFHLAEQSIGPR